LESSLTVKAPFPEEERWGNFRERVHQKRVEKKKKKSRFLRKEMEGGKNLLGGDTP